MPTKDGIVSGTSGEDEIKNGYVDANGDEVDAGDAILPGETGDDDIIDAGDGNDVIEAGDGNDEVYAGGGDDYVEGNAGDDLIYGDSVYDDGSSVVRESLNWSLVPGFGAGADATGFTQNTGTVDVTFSVINETGDAISEYETDQQNVDGIVDDGAPVDDDSSFYSQTKGEGNDGDYRLDFSDPVSNVSFRINDVDGDGKVSVYALDADGNKIPVELTAGSNLTLSDEDGVNGVDTVDSQGGYMPDTSSEYSVLVGIDGPVSAIIIEHDQDGPGDSGINVTDVYFDAGTAPDAGEPGDDILIGGDGNDEIHGEEGDDLIYGDNAGQGQPVTYRESLNWSEVSGFGDRTDASAFTQNTGHVDVTFSVLNETGDAISEYEVTDQNVDGIDGDGNPIDANSSFYSQTQGEGNEGDYQLEFSDTVSNVSFRINDVDGDGVVKVFAYDADGNKVEVDLDGGSDVTISDSDGEAGDDTIDSNGGYLPDDSPEHSTLVSIAGPVSKIVIEHDQDDLGDSGINVTDIYFDVTVGDEGAPGDDMLFGEDGEDEIYGEEGDDTIDGGAGNDTIDGGDGADDMSGGDDRDLFVNVNVGDVINGDEGGDDWDTLDLTGSEPAGGSFTITKTGPDENGNGFNGFVNYFDGDGNDVGKVDFYNIEKIIPCFTPGTLIATPKGERRVEELQPGDRVITRDNGIQELAWVGAKSMSFKELAAEPHLRPVLIKAGALGNGLPERDMMVSPNHRVLVANDRTALYFDEREVLAAAKHLVDNQGIVSVEPMGLTYIHFMFEHHEVVLSDGAWTESFQPGDYSLKGVGNAQRQEIYELFPELESREGLEDYTAARRILKKHEAQMLVAR